MTYLFWKNWYSVPIGSPARLRDLLARERLEADFEQQLARHQQQVVELLVAALLRRAASGFEDLGRHARHPSR